MKNKVSIPLQQQLHFYLDSLTETVYIVTRNAGWSSLVARRAHNPKVIGSNPFPATKYIKHLTHFGLSAFFVLVVKLV